MIFLRTSFSVCLLLLIGWGVQAQVTIYSEDFNAYPDGTTVGPDWNALLFNNCDSDVINGVDFDWGVFGGEFLISDTEGFNCCELNGLPNPTAQFGDSGNTLTFGPINISGYLSIEINLDFTTTGDYECAFTDFNNEPCPGADAEPYCQGGHDQAIFSYQVDGNAPVVFGYYCGDNFCFGQPFFCGDLSGDDLTIIITAGTQSDSESYALDNVEVIGYDTPNAEATANGDPISITICEGDDLDLNEIGGEATSWSWMGPNSFTSMLQDPSISGVTLSNDGDYIVEITTASGCTSTSTITVNVEPAPMISTPPPLILCYSLIPLTGEILNLDEIIDELTNFDPTLDVSFFFDMDGNDPLDPTDPGDILTLVSNFQTTIFASVSDGGSCPSNIVPVSIDLNEYPTPDDAMLTACADASGNATFTPSDADGDITGGDPDLTVTYHNTPGDAENGDDPIIGDVTTSTDVTLYASVQNAAGCTVVAELDLIVSSGVTAEDAALEACDDGSGQGTFDLTEVEATILNGQSGTVIFYEDSGLNDEIFDPANYTSDPGIIYAVIDDGMGCFSAPAEVTLSLITIDPNDLFLTFSPDEACGDAIIGVTINTPFDPPGDYTFEVSYGPISTGPTNNITLIGMDGATNFFLFIEETHIFTINSVTGPGPSDCIVTFSPPEEYIVEITEGPDAFPVNLTVCGDGSGSGTFDLTTLVEEINGFSGNPVDFYEDDLLNDQILNPDSYVSGPATIYAVVDDGTGCTSAPVEVTLDLEPEPGPIDLDLDLTSSCEEETVTLTFSLPNGESFDLNLITTDGSGSTQTLLTSIENNDQQSFTVSETTTFTIDEITTESGCTFALAPTPSVTITIGTADTPTAADLEACDNGNGEAVFDLTSVNDIVNNGSGDAVVWYTDIDGTDPIPNPANYTSSSGSVFAAIDNGTCVSETVEVTLTVFDLPTAMIDVDEPVSCESADDGEISVSVTGPMPHTYDWNDDTYDGQQILTDLDAGFYELTFTDGNGCQTVTSIDLAEPEALDLNCTVISNETAPGAENGEMSFNISGGTPLYQASLTGPLNATFDDLSAGNQFIDGLPPGDYTLTLTDANGCMNDCSFTIEAAVCTLDITLQIQEITCNDADDGGFTIIINAGTPDFTYDWSDDQFDGESELDELPPGTYSVTVTDADGCEVTESYTLVAPDPLTLDCNANTVGQGNGPGSYTFTYGGGTPGYTLELTGPESEIFTDTEPGVWDSDVLPEGNYTFTVLDENGCSTSCSFTIDPDCDLSLDLSGDAPTCNGSADGNLALDITSSQVIVTIDWSEDAYDGMTTITSVPAGTYSVIVTDANDCTASANITLNDPGAYVFDCTATSLPSGPGAMDGSLTVTITDGPGGPYTVSYDNGAGNSGTITENPMPLNSFTQTDLPPGIYAITITNSDGCTATCEVDLQVPACPLTLSQNIVAPTCSDSDDGMITVTVEDGTSDYEYDWSDDTFDGSPSATGLMPGTALSITVTDAVGCEGTLDFLVPTPTAIVVDCSAVTDPSNGAASDGSIDVVISGGAAPYTVNWSGPVSGSAPLADDGTLPIENLSAGAYTITVQDANSCSVICQTMLVAAACDLTVDLTGENPDCAEASTGSLDLTITGSAAIMTIDWNVDAYDGTEDPQNVPAGDYSVTVTDVAGCTATAMITLTDPPAIVVDCSQLTHPSTPAGTNGGVDVFVGGGTAPYDVSWDGPVTGMTTLAAAGTFSISGLSVGAYTITVVDADGCTEFCGFVMINNENCNFTAIPFATAPTCNGADDGSVTFQLIEGTPNFTFTWNDSSLDSEGPDGDLDDLGPGDYSVTILDNSNCVATASFTLEEPDPIVFSCMVTTQPSSGTASDGVITIDFVSGPGGPYTLTFDNGMGTSGSQAILPGILVIDNLPVGLYNISIDDGTCSVECNVQLIDNSCTFDLDLVVTPEQCAGAEDGTAVVTPSGGTEPYTFIWSNTEITAEITDLAPGNYSVTVTDAADCVASGTVTVLPGTPLPEAIPGAGVTICTDSCYLLPIDFIGVAPFELTYSITFGGTTLDFQETFNDNTGNLLICPATAGIPIGDFELQFSLLTDADCENTLNSTTIFTYLPPAVGTFTPTICREDSVQVGDLFFGFDNPNGQVVLPGAASSGCDSTVTVDLDFFAPSTLFVGGNICSDDTLFYGGVAFFNGNLSGVVVLEDAGSNGCDSTIIVDMDVLPSSTNPISPTLCAGDTIVIAGEVFDVNRPFDIIELPNQAANGCDSLIIVTLDIVPLVPTPLVLTLCPGDSLTVGDSLLITAGNYDILLPDAAANGCDSLVAVTLDFLAPATGTETGTYCIGEEVMVGDSLFTAANPGGTVTLPDASSNGCDSIVTVDLMFLPGVTTDLDSVLCFGSSLTIGGQVFDAQNPNGVVVLENEAANGCDSTINVTTTYLPELFASVGPDTLVCGDQVLDAVVILSPGAIYDFGVQVSTGFLFETEDVAGGEYTFGLGTIDSDITLELVEVTSSTGCPVTIENGFATIQYSNTQLSLNSTGGTGSSDLSCSDSQDGSIQAQLTGGVGPFTYDWSTGADGSTLDNLGPGTYSLTVTDAPGCSVEAEITFVGPPPLSVEAQGLSAGCFGETTGSITIDTVFGGTGPYEFSLDNEFFFGLGDFPNTVPDLMAGGYTVYVQDANDCQVEINLAVPEGIELDLELGDDQTIQAGDSVLLDPIYFFEAAAWKWTPPTGLSSPDTTITYAAPLETTIYQLEITDPNGCTTSDIVRIFVERDINVYIPNAFTPDGDGINDEIMIFAGAGVEMVESFQIFDRWGDQVYGQGPFPPNDPNFGWDGRMNEEVMNSAVFVYFARVRLATGEVVILEGDFVLLR